MKRAWDGWLALGCGLVAGVLYLRTLAPGLLFGDAGEFQVAAWIGGLAHPTGYPLYLILGWIWTHLLPLQSPAWRMNLLSALCGASAVGLVYLAASALIAQAIPRPSDLTRWLGAVVAALAFAVTPTFWSQAVIAEVYTLHALLIAVTLIVALRSDQRERDRWGALGCALGVGLTHHRTTLLLLPGLLGWAWLRRPEQPWPSRRQARAFLLGVLLPQFLYLYIPLRAPVTPYLTVPLGPGQALTLYDQSLSGFLAFVMGRAFVGELLSPAQAWAQLPTVLSLIRSNLSLPGIILAALGLAWLARRRCWDTLALTGLTALAQLGFNLFYGIGDVHVLYIPIYLIAALWIGVGLTALTMAASRLVARAGRSPLRAVAIPALGLLLPISLAISSFSGVDRSRDDRARRFWDGILGQPLPAASVLISNDRDEMVPLIYLQYVEGRRRDMTGLFPLMVREPGWLNVGQVTQSALKTGRPIFLVKPMPGLEVRFELRPHGTVVEVVGEVTAPPSGPLGVIGDALVLQAVEVSPGQVSESKLHAGRPLTVTLYWQPLRALGADYTSFVHVLDGYGEKIAQHDAPPGGVYYPTSLWQPGEILRDRHVIHLPEKLPTGPYALRIGLYTGPDLSLLGEPLLVSLLSAQKPLLEVLAAQASPSKSITTSWAAEALQTANVHPPFWRREARP
ncbi:MAG: DUF2723 domain-containing protein [Anaerolineae bacterium]|nr:DUF2723 domain-containing protein [Anaerolineae bacterium]MDW8099109.1 DUF2723 domain-containing protein [Anaerolineae bacterium]